MVDELGFGDVGTRGVVDWGRRKGRVLRCSLAWTQKRGLAVLATVVPLTVLGYFLPGLETELQAKSALQGLAVASEAPMSASGGLRVLQEGGTAADAAVVAALIAGVVNSSSSGIGGGGFVNYWDAKSQKATILDFRETAPAGLRGDEFEARPFPPNQRGKWVGVPGEVAGLSELHRRFGSKPWEELVKRAAELATNGYALGPHVHRVLLRSQEHVVRDVGLKSLWWKTGSAPEMGSKIRNPALGRTLQRIATEGPRAFYEGSVAAELVSTVSAHGGSLSLQDMAAYRPVERAPLAVDWADQTFHMMPAPSAGGYLLAHTLKMFSPAELSAMGHNTPAYLHALAESFRAAIADRMKYFGDPAFVAPDVEALLSPQRIAQRRSQFSDGLTHVLPRFISREHGTHHIAIADADGNVASITLTVNRAFGAKLTAPMAGVVLNDELDDFTMSRWVAPLGVKQSPNRARPGARPVSSMNPTVVTRNGRAVLAAGGSGGMTIATNVAQAVLASALFDFSPEQAVALPRFEIPLGGGTIKLESGFPETTVQDLALRGERVLTSGQAWSAVQMVELNGARRRAGADPRKFGLGLAQ